MLYSVHTLLRKVWWLILGGCPHAITVARLTPFFITMLPLTHHPVPDCYIRAIFWPQCPNS